MTLLTIPLCIVGPIAIHPIGYMNALVFSPDMPGYDPANATHFRTNGDCDDSAHVLACDILSLLRKTTLCAIQPTLSNTPNFFSVDVNPINRKVMADAFLALEGDSHFDSRKAAVQAMYADLIRETEQYLGTLKNDM